MWWPSGWESRCARRPRMPAPPPEPTAPPPEPPARRPAQPTPRVDPPGYRPVARHGPESFGAHLLEFAEDLRSEGVAVGTSEILDAFQALEQVSWTDRADFRESLSATLAKSPEDRRVFELVFERFFFRAVEAEAARQEITEGPGGMPSDGDIDLDALRQQIAAALRDGS